MSRRRFRRWIAFVAVGATTASVASAVAVSADPQATTSSLATNADLAPPTARDLAPRLTAATFADPPTAVRPKYRWWMPMAFTDDAELRAELADMKASGAGGAEVASFEAVGPQASDPEFLAEYGWGSPRWQQKVQTMLEAADELDLGLDLTIGPRWPAIVPTVDDINDPRAEQQLVFSHAFLPGGSTYDRPLPSNLSPDPPEGANRTLVAALVARCSETSCADQTSEPRLLDRDSVVDVTDRVTPDETLTYQLPGDASQTYAVIAFYQTADGQNRRNYTTTTKPNYYLDHLSKQGVAATTDFYESSILSPEVQRAIDAVGRVDLYEDSLELGGSQKWTWNFAEQWEQRRGYSPIRVLPALAGAGDQGLTATPYFDFSDGSGARIRTDYRQTWSDLYINARLNPLRSWAHDHGMLLRSQPYGTPIDTPEASSHVDVPEGESLAFFHNIEDYKLEAVGAHLTGNPVVSNECCATRESVWATTAGGWREPGNLHAIYRGYAGGVTQVVWHGYPYLTRGTGGSAQTLWPGMSYGGNTSFAEAWGVKGGPNWQDYKAINDHLGRLQLVLRQGKPRFDVAVYWQDFGMNGHGTTGDGSKTLLTSDSPLAQEGYTYEYVSPGLLRRPDATVSAGRLFPDSAGYRALVVFDQETMAVATARRMLDLARDGLRIVIVGDLPATTPGFHDATAQDAELAEIMSRLGAHRNVTRVDTLGEVPTALRHRGVAPAAAHQTKSADVVSVRRQDPTTDYYFLFNQASSPIEQELQLQGAGKPYRLNTWTGEITPITDYRATKQGVVVDVALDAADTTVIALTTRQDDTFRWSHGTPPQPTTPRNDGTLGPVRLDDWSLTVESWTPGESGLPGDTATTELPAVRPVPDARGELPPWSRISPEDGYDVDLRDVSGVGTYTSTFTLPDSWTGVRGAYLNLGDVVDTATVTVNGEDLPPVNPQDLGRIEVGDHLQPGDNTITVRVSSTLLNAVRVAPGTGASGRARADYGLLGPVLLTPYDARQPTLTVEPLEAELPLADGGTNRSRIRIANNSSKPVTVSVDTAAGDGVEAIAADPTLRIPGREAVTTIVRLRGHRATGTSALDVDVTGNNGTSGQAYVTLLHSDNLALNTTGSPFPRVWASSNQDRYPAWLATDGDNATFWVSGGRAPGWGPTADDPEIIGVDLGDPTTIRAIGADGREQYGTRSYDIQTSLDGKRWSTIKSVVDAPQTGAVTPIPPTRARFVRLRITDTWSPRRPADNTQLREFTVYSKVGNKAWLATPSASSTHSRFNVAAVNDGYARAQTDYSVWNAGNGWNDANSGSWPDTLTLTWQDPVTLSEARVFTVDNGTNSAPTHGLRDYDVQALVDGRWQTVATVRGNTSGTIESAFDPVTTTALRLSITDSNDHSYSRVVEFEAW